MYGVFLKENTSGLESVLGPQERALCEITAMGLPVLQGFVLTHDAYEAYAEAGNRFPPELKADLWKNLEQLEALAGQKIGDPKNPLGLCVSWDHQSVFLNRDDKPADLKEQLLETVGNMYAQMACSGGHGSRSLTIQAVSGSKEGLGAGIAFTRHPATGGRKLYGKYIKALRDIEVDVQKEDLTLMADLLKDDPEALNQAVKLCAQLERHFRDMQEIKFVIENGTFRIIQAQTARRTAEAAVSAAVNMAYEGMIEMEEALMRVTPESVNGLVYPWEGNDGAHPVVALGVPAGHGTAVGQIVFDAETAKALEAQGIQAILARPALTEADLDALEASAGILASEGDITSETGVLARSLNKVCVCGCLTLDIDVDRREIRGENGLVLKAFDVVTLDGGAGIVIQGEARIEPRFSDELRVLISWADQTKQMNVLADADHVADCKLAQQVYAEGIGLCRTDYMFTAPDRIGLTRKMLLAATQEERDDCLARLLTLQEHDFRIMFQVLQDLPVTIRLLDVPLQDLLSDIPQPGRQNGAGALLGYRGCRLGARYPEIYRMQVKAIIHAMSLLVMEGVSEGFLLFPEIQIPMVINPEELNMLRQVLDEAALEVRQETNTHIYYKIGAMIETPQACLKAGAIAQNADVLSFDTDALTQMTLGLSRETAENQWLEEYLEKGLLKADPFRVLDPDGVGKLLEMAVKSVRQQKPTIKMGISGGHSSNPESIDFCHRIGMDYISCPPMLAPGAKLAAAQAVIRQSLEE
jgi:pyruvate,orthophosphate dikinase